MLVLAIINQYTAIALKVNRHNLMFGMIGR